MDKSVESYLLALELGAAQGFENMAVYPLLASLDGGPEYIPLKTALERGVFAVTEVSAGGSVPDLLVTNKADVAVLLLDGEELAGAKQNRVLNTTILVAPRASVKVPVSCTEQGRWHYVSKEFQDSGNVLAAAMRGAHHREVNLSLASSRQYRADQSMVWGRVASMARVMDVASATGAMRDVFEARSADLEGYLKSFSLVDHQKGFLVLLDGRPAGFDFISRENVFAVLFPKLVKSYAMEALLLQERKKAGRGASHAEAKSAQAGEEKAKAFLKKAADSEEKKYESVGLGWSYRYQGPGVVGSALAVNEKVVHMAFFAVDEADVSVAAQDPDNLVSTGKRRRFHFR